MKHLMDAFAAKHIYNVPDICYYLQGISNGVRIWMYDNVKDFTKATDSVQVHGGNGMPMPIEHRIKATFPHNKQFRFILIYASVDYWTYFFLPVNEFVTVNDVLYKFLQLCERTFDDDYATFLQTLKDDDYDMNSMDFWNLKEINEKGAELKDLLPKVLRKSDHRNYEEMRKELSLTYIKQKIK